MDIFNIKQKNTTTINSLLNKSVSKLLELKTKLQNEAIIKNKNTNSQSNTLNN